MAELAPLLDILNRGGLVFVAVLILYGGAKRYWVWGYQLREAQSERDEWKAMALRSADISARATSTTAQVVTQQLVSR
jgi:hypothetical protein